MTWLDDLLTFMAMELDCARCGSSVPIADLRPYARGGFVCAHCLLTMPTAEFRALVRLGRMMSGQRA